MLGLAWDPMTDPDEPDSVRLGNDETILDPTDELITVEPYAVIDDELPEAEQQEQQMRELLDDVAILKRRKAGVSIR